METVFFIVHATVTSLTDLSKNHCFVERVASCKKPQYQMTCYDSENDRDVLVKFIVLDWWTSERLPLDCLSKKEVSLRLAKKNFHPYRSFKS